MLLLADPIESKDRGRRLPVTHIGPILEYIVDDDKLSIKNLFRFSISMFFSDDFGRIYDPNGRLVSEAPLID